MRKAGYCVLFGIFVLSGCSHQLSIHMASETAKVSEFEQLDFHQLMKRYMNKEASLTNDIEGIYSVSIVIEKKSTPLFGTGQRDRVVERKDNYATVAILRDPRGNREFMELSLDKEKQPSYSVRGEFTAMNDARIMIYKHFEPKGKSVTYTFSSDKEHDLLEGVRTEVEGRAEYTYKLMYLKLKHTQNGGGSY